MRHAWVFVAGGSFFLGIAGYPPVPSGRTRAAGGGGFQLQEPVFVFALAVILFLFALNLSGVFEIGMRLTGAGSSLTQKSGYSGSFFRVLAQWWQLLAWHPFWEGRGTALTMDTLAAFTVFTSIALGLASPYLILSFSRGCLTCPSREHDGDL